MRRSPLLACLCAVTAWAAACDGSDPADVDTDTPADTPTDTPTDTPADTDPAADTDAPDALPLVGEAFDCGRATNVGGLGEGNGATFLERHVLDTALFPDALCNDGSAALFYFRPADDPAYADKWVLELQGGGGCSSPELCAKRWCSVDTNFSMTQMTSSTSPLTTDGTGILARSRDGALPADNPLEHYNQVLIKYCSSDTWRGTARDAAVEAPHPSTGALTPFRLHFLGHRIIEATLATLQRDPTPALFHVGLDAELPDLDDATEVVLAGASAGGGGVTFTLDWLQQALRERQPATDVLGLIDSTFAPDLIGLDFTQSAFCLEQGLCTDEAFLTFGEAAQDDLWHAVTEESCEDVHATDGAAWKCASDTHVILNHLQTPFFVRQGLADTLISDTYVDGGLRKNGQPFTMNLFGTAVREHIESFPTLDATAEEGATLTQTPGGYGPLCSKHETLRSTPDTFSVTILPTGGVPKRMFDVWNAWRSGVGDAAVASQNSQDSSCP
jgi:hypothetical protein